MTISRRRLAPIVAWLGLVAALGPAPAGPAGRWLGQDGHDLVGTAPTPGPSDVQDIHFHLTGLPPGAKVASATVRAAGGGEWKLGGPPGSWLALVVKAPGASSADVYIEPYQAETGRTFEIGLTFDDGRSTTIVVRGGKADHRLRMPSSRLEARWVGQDRRDLVGPGPNAGPDGVQDAHIALGRLAARADVRSILIEGPGGQRWQFGPNPEALPRAELVRQPGDPARADLFFQPTRDLGGPALKLTLTYADGKTDSAGVTAGKADPALAMPTSGPPTSMPLDLRTRWLGHGGVNPGDVRVAIDGLPAAGRIVGVDLGDGEVAAWSDRGAALMPDSLPLTFRRADDPTRAELAFPPARDESGATMTLRLVLADGRSAVGSFPGGPCDPSLRAEGPARTSVVARPGDDLNDLANRFGVVDLAAGVHRMSRPLVLNRPVTVAARPGAEVVFAQGSNEPAWTSAIKIHAGRTTLDGLAIRFEGPVRWDRRVAYGPAVLGTTDDRDRPTGRVLAGLTFTQLDVQAPPASSKWEEAPGVFRLVGATNGTIERNTLRGGMIELWGGPWRIAENTFDGPRDDTFAHALIAAHEPHDLTIAGNTARQRDARGKAWRWLVLTNRGANVRVADNRIAGIGPRDDDRVAHPNAPETILTESYRLNFEGKAAGVSADGLVVAIPPPQGGPARAGSVLAILSGPQAGQWRRVVLPLGPESYLLDRPVALGGGAVALGPGFVGTSFEGNAIDDLGSTVAIPFVLAGQHFGTKVANNTTRGGGFSARVVATATESPGPWGWSHTAMFGLAIEGNTFEDARHGALLIVEHNEHTRPSRGRVYASGMVANNVFAATDAVPGKPVGLTIGEPPSGDLGELVVTESGNRSRGRPVALRIRAATINGRAVRDETVVLPAGPGSSAGREPSPRR